MKEETERLGQEIYDKLRFDFPNTDLTLLRRISFREAKLICTPVNKKRTAVRKKRRK
jgi:hypothetical protein